MKGNGFMNNFKYQFMRRFRTPRTQKPKMNMGVQPILFQVPHIETPTPAQLYYESIKKEKFGTTMLLLAEFVFLSCCKPRFVFKH